MDNQKRRPPPVPKFSVSETGNNMLTTEVDNFLAQMQNEKVEEKINVIQQPVPAPTPAKNISNINDKLSTLLKNSKINQKLNPVVSKPIEYDPARPNEYEEIKKLLVKEEVPIVAIEAPMDIESSGVIEFGSGEEKALKMMEKFGFKFGTGLGKQGQGIIAPLVVKKTSNTIGVVEVSQVHFTDLLPQNVVVRRSFEQYQQQPSRVLVMLNVVTAKEVDEQLQVEVTEELQKYGKIEKTYIHVRPDLEDDLQVRIFAEFIKDEHAMQAFLGVDQRVFGNRIISCRFYQVELFENKQYDELL